MSRVVLVSGGSRGIGKSCCVMMAKQGWKTAFTYLKNDTSAQHTIQQIQRAGGVAVGLRADTSQEDEVKLAFDETLKTFGRLDAVVVNAGVVDQASTLADMSAKRLKNIFNINLFGSFLFAREAARILPHHVSDSGGSIVIVSSAASRLGAPFEYVDYASCKGALDTLTVGLSKELAGQNIRVNAVRPGMIATEIHASGGQHDRLERLSGAIPLGRAGEADEVANAISWLCSDEASYCTGAILDVSGGR